MSSNRSAFDAIGNILNGGNKSKPENTSGSSENLSQDRSNTEPINLLLSAGSISHNSSGSKWSEIYDSNFNRIGSLSDTGNYLNVYDSNLNMIGYIRKNNDWYTIYNTKHDTVGQIRRNGAWYTIYDKDFNRIGDMHRGVNWTSVYGK